MSRKVEIEYKCVVGKELFEELLTKCEAKYSLLERKIHANYYYDTEDNALNKLKTTVRVRQYQNNLILQIKKNKKEKGSMIISDECSKTVDELPNILKISDSRVPLLLKGVLITDRRIYVCEESFIICLDVNLYLGICDYEIEIEAIEYDEEKLLSILEYLALGCSLGTSKSHRFFQRLGKI